MNAIDQIKGWRDQCGSHLFTLLTEGTRGSWSCALAVKGCWKPRQVLREARTEAASSQWGVGSSGPHGYMSWAAGRGSNGQQEKSPLILPEESGLRSLHHRQVIPSGAAGLAGRLSDIPLGRSGAGHCERKGAFTVESGLAMETSGALSFSQSLREAEPGLSSPQGQWTKESKKCWFPQDPALACLMLGLKA